MTSERPVTRALGYLRVSTEEQVNGNGLDAQRFTVIAEAERRGWAVDVIADEGASGKYVNSGLRDCLDQLATGRADALIVAKLDRLARSVRNAIDIIDAARDQGWDLVVSTSRSTSRARQGARWRTCSRRSRSSSET